MNRRRINKNNLGWRGIGRSLVLGISGPDCLSDRLSGPNVLVIQLEEEPAKLVRRKSLSPDLMDVVVLDATTENAEQTVELSRVLRARQLASVLVFPRNVWGKRMFRSYLGVFSHEGAVQASHLWMAVSVAAQLTWTLGWARADRKPKPQEPKKAKASAISMQSALLCKSNIEQTRPSRTTPWAPPPALLVELTKAYNDEAET